MLLIVTKPPKFCAGNFKCIELSREDASILIKGSHSNDQVAPYIFHGSTKRALAVLTGIDFEIVQKTEVPQPRDGDLFLLIQVSPSAPRGRPRVEDLEFLQIEFSL
ncbi:hypothetical protein [Mariniblastus fucicola]|uniref:DUF1874 domain-containing protein n=1 Tax=Mariniblastus fucicola TaxID=980251 RepID=A0A5B9PFS2_9BACT|nr:hypothetical protein [Mariniblastus fucicola]QEG25164.1 hypothetical protein MFFC18_50880 [Mariniblastus fucicola]